MRSFFASLFAQGSVSVSAPEDAAAGKPAAKNVRPTKSGIEVGDIETPGTDLIAAHDTILPPS